MINVGRMLHFHLNGMELVRRLVWEVEDWEMDVSVGTPVGAALEKAVPGDVFTVDVPDGTVRVRVLEVE